MKKVIILFLALSVSSMYACTSSNSQPNSAITEVQEAVIAKDVSAKAFADLINSKKNAILLDVRTPKEVAEGHIANSVNIDYFTPEFKSELAKLDKTKPILVYCHSGRRSGNTVAALKEMGFTEIYNLETGIVGWEEAGLPVEK